MSRDTKNETLAELSADLRVLSDKWIDDKSMTKTECLGLIAHQIADRIDAAAKRERSDLDALERACESVLDASSLAAVIAEKKRIAAQIGGAA